MSFFEKRGNNAVGVNPPILQGQFADIHITEHGSDWLWAAFAIFATATLVFLGLGYTKHATDRIFHYITAGITLVAALTYFTLASDLGFVPIPVEFRRTNHHVSGATRQVFYVRYINWFITSPLILLDILLTAGVPWPQILFTVLLDWVVIVSALAGALTPTRYKWGYFTFAGAALFYILYTIVIPARRHARALGSDIVRAFSTAGLYIAVLWVIYPIAWAVSEGGNVIAPDSEAVFYGVLDVLTTVGFGAILLFGHRNIDPARLGLRLRGYDDEIAGAGAGGHHARFGLGRGEKDVGQRGTGNGVHNGAAAA